MIEAQFLAGEDARGVFVVLEPETPLGAAQFDALADARRMSSQNQAKSRQKRSPPRGLAPRILFHFPP